VIFVIQTNSDDLSWHWQWQTHDKNLISHPTPTGKRIIAKPYPSARGLYTVNPIKI
jgi:hypothetical protein